MTRVLYHPGIIITIKNRRYLNTTNDLLIKNLKFFGKLLIATGGMLSMMWGYQYWFSGQFAFDALYTQAALIVTSGALGAGIFCVLTFWLNIEEVRFIFTACAHYASQKLSGHQGRS